ncbi:sialate O-acetylesterase [Chryseolinea lacunae]|uniref:Sialate O-acetylesterase n=1 Tax=Chryseolinea lacunae TaxID=2801331 RepID=A0ABS1KMF5_9BACT|nr:sialate O-acetylesterase [Chryseolinea lacunae]MBL0740650.1 sialate O-acetylesterase [Chryseolinea lacunae]
MKKLILFSVAMLCTIAVSAHVRMPGIFTDHAVLQRNAPIKIWGWADKGERVTVYLNGFKKAVVTDQTGRWLVVIPEMVAGGPYELVVQGKNTIRFTDILIGEVWLCSGQSNMQFVVQNTASAKTEIAKANWPTIRHFKVKEKIAASPSDDVAGGSWTVCSPETVPSFTAVGYFFAKALNHELNVPVGIVNASWGGTYIEAWMSHSTLIKNPDYRDVSALTDHQLSSWFASVEALYADYGKKLGIESFTNYKTNDSLWHRGDCADLNWISIPFPGDFDKTVLPRFDGTVWFRGRFRLADHTSPKGWTLHLGKVEDYGDIFINGKRIGGASNNTNASDLVIDASVLTPGENVIAIKINDYWETGGFTSHAQAYYLEGSEGVSSRIELSGLPWKMNFASAKTWIRTPNVQPNVLFNGMVNPVIPYTVKGVLWYQGENNAEYAFQYRQLLPALIADWRARFDQPEMPFYFVQLPNYLKYQQNSKNGGAQWAEIRESMQKTLAVPNTGMAVTIDLGDSTDVHPRNKEDVGKRLSLIALNHLYGKKYVSAGPEVKSVSFENGRTLITFREGARLIARDRYGYLRGFEVAGKDKIFFNAAAVIKGNVVVVESPLVVSPEAVRYSWSNNPDGNLYNEAGLPASPFRSDDWVLTTEERKFDRWINNMYPVEYKLSK